MSRARMYVAGSGLAALAFGSVLALALGGQSAGAAPGAVTASTHEAQNPDTTSGTVTSDPGTGFGYVWAYDTVTKQFTATSDGHGGYVVDETVVGSFTAFSSPNTGQSYDTPIKVTGSIYGTNEYTVESSTAPKAGSLPAQTPAGTSTSTIIGEMFPGGSAVVSGGDKWVFTYKAGAETYTQSYAFAPPSYATGNITGH
jgi:hypothetical protein